MKLVFNLILGETVFDYMKDGGVKINTEESELLTRVKEIVRGLDPGAEVILFGSRARGMAEVHSDWDFLILLTVPRHKEIEARIKDRLYDLEIATDTVLTSLIRTKEEWMSPRYSVLPFKQQVERDGIPL